MGFTMKYFYNIIKGFVPALFVMLLVYSCNEEKPVESKTDDCCGMVEFAITNMEQEAVQFVEITMISGEKNVFKNYTDKDGKVTFNKVCPGEYDLRIFAETYIVIEEQIIVEECDTLDKSYILKTEEDERKECCHGIINFKVNDKVNRGIPGVTVRLWMGSVKIDELETNEEGFVNFKEICEGNYQISFFKDGMQGQEFTFEMGCNDTLNQHKTMLSNDDKECCNGVLQIHLMDEDSREPISGAVVKLFKEGRIVETLETQQGIVVFDHLCEGAYGVLIQKDGYDGAELQVEIPCNEIVTKKIYINKDKECCDGIIYVFPRDKETKHVLNGATVKLRIGGTVIDTKIAENGQAAFYHVCEGEYEIVVLNEGYKGIEHAVKMPCNETVKVEIGLEKNTDCCQGQLIVLVTDSDTQEMINGALVKLWKDGKVVREAETQNGLAIFRELCEGKYGLDVLKEGYNAREMNVEMPCNQTITKSFVLEKKEDCCKSKIYLVLNDALTQKGIPHALVELKDRAHPDNIKSNNTNDKGLVIFENVCEGSYILRCVKEGYYTGEYEVEIGCNKELELHKTMKPKNSNESDTCETAVMKLILRDMETGEPITGVKILIYRGDKIVGDPVTNEEGVAIEEGLLAPAEYLVFIRTDRYGVKEFTWKFTECKVYQETFRLEKR